MTTRQIMKMNTPGISIAAVMPFISAVFVVVGVVRSEEQQPLRDSLRAWIEEGGLTGKWICHSVQEGVRDNKGKESPRYFLSVKEDSSFTMKKIVHDETILYRGLIVEEETRIVARVMLGPIVDPPGKQRLSWEITKVEEGLLLKSAKSSLLFLRREEEE